MYFGCPSWDSYLECTNPPGTDNDLTKIALRTDQSPHFPLPTSDVMGFNLPRTDQLPHPPSPPPPPSRQGLDALGWQLTVAHFPPPSRLVWNGCLDRWSRVRMTPVSHGLYGWVYGRLLFGRCQILHPLWCEHPGRGASFCLQSPLWTV